jgi:hypothetical protein
MKKEILAGLLVLAIAPALYADFGGTVGIAGFGTVDYWVVTPPSPGIFGGAPTTYEYYYEFNDTVHALLDHITIDSAAAFRTGFGTLAGDLNPLTGAITGEGITDVALNGGVGSASNVTWSPVPPGNTIDPGETSYVMYITSTLGPVPGLFKIHNGGPEGSVYLPVPGVPAPGAALLIAVGLAGVGWFRRRIA